MDVLDRNDAPVIADQVRTIRENLGNGEPVGAQLAYADEERSSLRQSLSFSIIGGNTHNAFTINSEGQLSVFSTGALDFEDDATREFKLVVRVQDSGSPSLGAQATITVKLLDVNEAPVFTSNAFSALVPENSDAGTKVGAPLTFTDVDSLQTHVFSIVGASQ